MSELFASGHAIDFILALVLAEAAGMVLYRRLTGSGIPLAGFLANLASGACLLLALRAGLTGAAWEVVALFLLGGLAAHMTDIVLRLRA